MNTNQMLKWMLISGILGFTALLSLSSVPQICLAKNNLGPIVVTLDGSPVEVPLCSSHRNIVVPQIVKGQLHDLEQLYDQLDQIAPFEANVSLGGRLESYSTTQLQDILLSTWLNSQLKAKTSMDLPIRLALSAFFKKILWGVSLPGTAVVSVEKDGVAHVSTSGADDSHDAISALSSVGFISGYLYETYSNLSFLDRLSFGKKLIVHLQRLNEFSRSRQASFSSIDDWLIYLKIHLVTISPITNFKEILSILENIKQLQKPKALVQIYAPSKAQCNLMREKIGTTFALRCGNSLYLQSSTVVLSLEKNQLQVPNRLAVVSQTDLRFRDLRGLASKNNRILLVAGTDDSSLTLLNAYLKNSLSAAMSETVASKGLFIHLPSVQLALNYGLNKNAVVEDTVRRLKEKSSSLSGVYKMIGKDGSIPLFERIEI